MVPRWLFLDEGPPPEHCICSLGRKEGEKIHQEETLCWVPGHPARSERIEPQPAVLTCMAPDKREFEAGSRSILAFRAPHYDLSRGSCLSEGFAEVSEGEKDLGLKFSSQPLK